MHLASCVVHVVRRASCVVHRRKEIQHGLLLIRKDPESAFRLRDETAVLGTLNDGSPLERRRTLNLDETDRELEGR